MYLEPFSSFLTCMGVWMDSDGLKGLVRGKYFIYLSIYHIAGMSWYNLKVCGENFARDVQNSVDIHPIVDLERFVEI